MKVWCKNCKWFWYYAEESPSMGRCFAPENIIWTDHYWPEIDHDPFRVEDGAMAAERRKKKNIPESINRNNDCKWYIQEIER